MKTKIIPENQVAKFAKSNKRREKIIKRRDNILGCDIRVRSKGKIGKIYTTPYGKKIARMTIGAIGWLQLTGERMMVWYASYSKYDYPAWDIVWKKQNSKLKTK